MLPICAVRLSGRQLQAGSNTKKVLVIVHSGINTQQPIQMQNFDITTLNVDNTIQELADTGYLADLSGFEVHWFFLGDVSGEQPALSPEQVSALKSFWEAYLTASGASSITWESALPSTHAIQNAPEVPVVATKTSNVNLSQPISLDPEIIAFQPNCAQLADEKAAQQQLTKIAEAIIASGEHYLLAGSTADVDHEDNPQKMSNQEFGLLRAQAVSDLLCELGVERAQLTCVGLGDTPTSVRSKEDDQANRTVWLVALKSTLGNEFMTVGLAE